MTTTATCPFCERIERGEVDGTTLFRIVRFEPLNPVTPGHMLFVPRAHRVHGATSGAVMAVGRAMEAAVEYGAHVGEDFNLIISSGAAATQTVPHIHIHYVPRRPGDGLALPWTGQRTAPDPLADHLLEFDHPYYCAEGSYFANGCHQEYGSVDITVTLADEPPIRAWLAARAEHERRVWEPLLGTTATSDPLTGAVAPSRGEG